LNLERNLIKSIIVSLLNSGFMGLFGLLSWIMAMFIGWVLIKASIFNEVIPHNLLIIYGMLLIVLGVLYILRILKIMPSI